MKTGLFLSLITLMILTTSASLEAGPRLDTVGELRKEIYEILKNRNLNFLEEDLQRVSVDFLINARNEVVILDVYGDSMSACEFVKETLNYKKVKFKQAKQLTRYMVNIRLMKNDL